MQSLAVHRSRKLIPEFVLHRPESLAEVCALLDKMDQHPGDVTIKLLPDPK